MTIPANPARSIPALDVSALTQESNLVRQPAELIIGPYRAGKTELLLKQLVAFCEQNPLAEAIVLVPSQRYQMLLEKRLKEVLSANAHTAGQVGIVGVKILNFQKLCELILRRAGTAFRVIPEQVRPAIISRCMNRLKDAGELKHVAEMVSFTGTHQAVLDLIDEFERAALTPDDVIRLLEKTAERESRYMELARIYSVYKSELAAAGFTDQKGLAFAARELLHGDQLKWHAGLVCVDGFDRFNSLQLQVLSGLSKHCHSLKICFDYLQPADDAADEYSWKESSYVELIKTLGANFQSLPVPSGGDHPQRKIVKFRAIDRQFEMEHIARQIKVGLVQEGRSPGDYLVVSRNIKAYRAAIAAAFDSAGLNYFIDEAISLRALPVVQFVNKLLNLAAEDFPRAAVISLLTSPFFNSTNIALTVRDVEFLDRCSRRVNVVRGRNQWDDIWNLGSDAPKSEVHAQLNRFFDIITPPSTATFHLFVHWLENVLEACLLSPQANSERDPFDVWEEQRALLEMRRIFAALVHEENIIGPHEQSIDRVLNRFAHLVDRSNFRRKPRSANAVIICGADLAPNQLAQEVFVAGLADGEFPKRPSQRGFLSTDEVGRWATFGINIQNPRIHPAFEFALFNSLVQRARTRVHLSCPLSDMSGEELTPSFFITEGDPNFEHTHAAITPFSAAIANPLSARELMSGHGWKSGSELISQEVPEHPDACSLREKLAAPLAVALARASARSASPFNGYLNDYVTSRAISVKVPGSWSASRLNEYGKCPFRYWVAHVLKTAPHEEPEEELSAKVAGELYHRALECFYLDMQGKGLQMPWSDEDEVRRTFETAIEKALLWLEAKREVRRNEFWHYQKNEIKFRLRRFFEYELTSARTDPEKFVPTLIEAKFGLQDEDSYPPLLIENGSSPIAVRGKIDRIDVAESFDVGPRIRVVDYKKGASAISDSQVIDGRNIQLPLYALAVERSILPGSKVIEAKYLSVSAAQPIGTHYFDGRKKRRPSTQPESTIDLLQITEGHVKRIVAGIASGDFSVAPVNKVICTSCDHRTICRIKEMTSDTTESEPGGE